MPDWVAAITVSFKAFVPNGADRTMLNRLKALGFEEVKSATEGKVIFVRLTATEKTGAETRIREMCEQLLTNPVAQEYRFQVFTKEDFEELFRKQMQ